MSARVTQLLRECGAVLKRRRKHEVYELPNGKNFVRASTPSDRRADLNSLSDLKRQLGVETVKEQASPSRNKLSRKRAPKGHGKAERIRGKVASLSLAESLRLAGLTDDALRERVALLERRVEMIESQHRSIQDHQQQCLACRVARWISKRIGRS